MCPQTQHTEQPSDDKRWKIVNATMRRNGNDAHALIETLHTVQEIFGFLDEDALRYVAKSLRTPLSRVYGVATFYHFFTLKPQGHHTCVVCTGTACHIKGSQGLVDVLKERFHVLPGETTPDNQLSVVSARCIGACSLAPAVVIDGKVTGGLSTQALVERVEKELG
jgi:bidirectional [NiFe] hydrogenase diaphorase subunit